MTPSVNYQQGISRGCNYCASNKTLVMEKGNNIKRIELFLVALNFKFIHLNKNLGN